jgi:hypothetical protein
MIKYFQFALLVAIASCTSVVSAQELSQRDRIHIAVQQICPVSGQRLGEHGPPIKVTVGQQKEEVFLCCKACLSGKINPEHWAAIHANYARAQGKCPVMNKALPRGSKWTIVQGRVVYVCCPPCIDKLKADPATYLRKLDSLYVASLQAAQGSQ